MSHSLQAASRMDCADRDQMPWPTRKLGRFDMNRALRRLFLSGEFEDGASGGGVGIDESHPCARGGAFRHEVQNPPVDQGALVQLDSCKPHRSMVIDR